MQEIYLLGAVRTPIGKYGGSLKGTPAYEMGALVMREAVSRAGVEPGQFDQVIMGEVRQSTEASNMARCAALAAGIPEQVPAYTVNRLCSSAMQAIYDGCKEIWCGDASIVLAGGSENMSRAPYYLRNGRFGDGALALVDSNIEAGTTAQPASLYGPDMSMGVTAENVAERYGITREQQDLFSLESQTRAQRAIREGWFKKEIVPVPIKHKKESVLFTTDEFPRTGTTLEGLAKLKPLFRTDGKGTVTAGNACGRNDGAAAVVLASERMVQQTRTRPLARIAGITSVALDPSVMGYGPVPAVRKVLEKTGLTLQDIDLFELNEAFASQSVACIRDLGIDQARVNIGGGAIALGHPLGATGCRLIVTLLHHLQRTNGHYGIATLCVGGGQGMATVIERL